jgi:hypothetical protein
MRLSTVHTWASAVLAVLALSVSPAYAQKGGGGGGSGGGGGQQPPNLFVGKWELGNYDFFTFNKDYTFALVLEDPYTQVITAIYTGTYTLNV